MLTYVYFPSRCSTGLTVTCQRRNLGKRTWYSEYSHDFQLVAASIGQFGSPYCKLAYCTSYDHFDFGIGFYRSSLVYCQTLKALWWGNGCFSKMGLMNLSHETKSWFETREREIGTLTSTQVHATVPVGQSSSLCSSPLPDTAPKSQSLSFWTTLECHW